MEVVSVYNSGSVVGNEEAPFCQRELISRLNCARGASWQHPLISAGVREFGSKARRNVVRLMAFKRTARISPPHR